MFWTFVVSCFLQLVLCGTVSATMCTKDRADKDAAKMSSCRDVMTKGQNRATSQKEICKIMKEFTECIAGATCAPQFSYAWDSRLYGKGIISTACGDEDKISRKVTEVVEIQFKRSGSAGLRHWAAMTVMCSIFALVCQ